MLGIMGEGVSGGLARVIVSSILFIVSGVMQTCAMQAILYSGGGDKSTYLIAVPNYFAIAAVYFVGIKSFKALDRFGVWTSGVDNSRVHTPLYLAEHNKVASSLPFFRKVFHSERRKLFVLALNETGGFLAGIAGLSIAGSGLYQVVFSGATVFTAMMSTAFLKKRLSYIQWMCLAMITFGLLITAEQVSHSSSEIGAASLITGMLFILLACLFYSTNYVIAEFLLDPHSNSILDEDHTLALPPPSGLDLCLYTGGSCFILFSIYVAFYTVPHWHELVTESIEKHHGRMRAIILQYVVLMCGAFLHAVTHYDTVATIGAVPVGVLNALRAVSVFGASSLMFCSQQASQCYNYSKFVATIVVTLGASGYSLASMLKKSPKRNSIMGPTASQSLPKTASARKVMQGVEPLISRSMSTSILADAELTLTSATNGWPPITPKRRQESSQQGDKIKV